MIRIWTSKVTGDVETAPQPTDMVVLADGKLAQIGALPKPYLLQSDVAGLLDALASKVETFSIPDGGAKIVINKSQGSLNFKKIVAGNGILITETEDTITFSLA